MVPSVMWRPGRRMFLLPLLLLLLWMNLSPTHPTAAVSVPVPYGSAGWGQGHQSIPGKTHYHRYHLQKKLARLWESIGEGKGRGQREKVILLVFIIYNYNYYKSYCLYPWSWRWWWTRPAHKQYDLFDVICSIHLTFRVFHSSSEVSRLVTRWRVCQN